MTSIWSRNPFVIQVNSKRNHVRKVIWTCISDEGRNPFVIQVNSKRCSRPMQTALKELRRNPFVIQVNSKAAAIDEAVSNYNWRS